MARRTLRQWVWRLFVDLVAHRLAKNDFGDDTVALWREVLAPVAARNLKILCALLLIAGVGYGLHQLRVQFGLLVTTVVEFPEHTPGGIVDAAQGLDLAVRVVARDHLWPGQPREAVLDIEDSDLRIDAQGGLRASDVKIEEAKTMKDRRKVKSTAAMLPRPTSLAVGFRGRPPYGSTCGHVKLTPMLQQAFENELAATRWSKGDHHVVELIRGGSFMKLPAFPVTEKTKPLHLKQALRLPFQIELEFTRAPGASAVVEFDGAFALMLDEKSRDPGSIAQGSVMRVSLLRISGDRDVLPASQWRELRAGELRVAPSAGEAVRIELAEDRGMASAITVSERSDLPSRVRLEIGRSDSTDSELAVGLSALGGDVYLRRFSAGETVSAPEASCPP